MPTFNFLGYILPVLFGKIDNDALCDLVPFVQFKKCEKSRNAPHVSQI